MMKFKIIRLKSFKLILPIAIVLLYFNKSLNAQVTFERYYDVGSSDMKEDLMGNFVFAGEYIDWTKPGFPSDVSLYKTDNFGVVKWSKKIGNGTDKYSGRDMAVSSDNGYVVLGTKTFSPDVSDLSLVKTNSSGVLQWAKVFSTPIADEGQWIIPTKDNGFALLGVSKQKTSDLGGRVIVIKTDNNGDLAWNKVYSFPEEVCPSAIEQTSDNGYIITGIYGPLVASAAPPNYCSGSVMIIKIDPNGTIQWTKKYKNLPADFDGAQDIIEIPGNAGYLVSGFNDPDDGNPPPSFAWVIKIAMDGTFIQSIRFQETIPVLGWSDWGFSEINRRSNGNYVLTGGGGYMQGDALYFLEIDANLNPIYKRYLPSTSYTGHSIFETSDNGIAVSATGILLKLNTEMLIDCKSFISYQNETVPLTSQDLNATVSNISASNDNIIITDIPNTSNYICPLILPEADFSSDKENACKDGCITFSDLSKNNPVSWEWSFEGGTPSASTLQNPIVCYNSNGVFNVKLVVADNLGRRDSITKLSFIEINAVSVSLDFSSNASCDGGNDGSATVSATGGTAPYTYSWQPSGGNSATAINLSAGTYTTIVTDASGCSATTVVAITQSGSIIALASSTNIKCYGNNNGTATVTINGGNNPYTYFWMPGGATTAVVNNLGAGNYTVTVTDNTGCTATATTTITEPSELPVVSPSANTNICEGQSTSLTASALGGTGVYAFAWNPGSLSGSPVSVNPAITTTYTVIATDASGCASGPKTVTVFINPALSVVAGGTEAICPGNNTPINAVGNGGSGGPYSYSWLPVLGLSNPNIATPSASPIVTTTYEVTVTDGCSPAVKASVTITVNPTPVVAFTVDNLSGCAPLCVNFDQGVTITSGSITSLSWSFGSAAATPINCFNAPGNYPVTLTATSDLGCTSTSAPLNITVFSDPVADFSYSPEQITVLEPQVCFTDKSIDAVSWEWDFGDANNNVLSTQQNPCHVYSDTGTYCITLRIKNANGCVDTIKHCLTVAPYFSFYIANALTPNGDGSNDLFIGKGTGIVEHEMWIFDRWGNLIYSTGKTSSPLSAVPWDGRANGGRDVAQQDVYVYLVKLKDVFRKEHKYRGTVSIVK